MDVHTRRLRYFLAVAEELHFGRAAARCFIAQQAMSRQIRELEGDLEVLLFERTTRAVRLTPSGEAFAAAVRSALATLDEGVEGARLATRTAGGTLNVGFRFGAALELTAPILERFAVRFPEIRVNLRELDFREPTRYADGDIDVAILKSPFSRPQQRFEALFAEPLVIAVGHRHPLAAQGFVTIADLAELTIVVADSHDPEWQRYWTLEEHLGPRPDAQLIHTNSITEELELVAAGVAYSVTMAAAARYMPHPGVSYLPIADVPPCTTGLGWNADRVSPLVEAFVATAVEVRDRETDIVSFIEDPFPIA